MGPVGAADKADVVLFVLTLDPVPGRLEEACARSGVFALLPWVGDVADVKEEMDAKEWTDAVAAG